ncbi:hypothetical protein ASZ90_018850 [hydrocarbon metagenome]|uniref:Copper amine oxidase-like N-terminal domain-containing protein n=1 Tax=hydrocarbon metagenome TaxID=938273 RepID=A0A0W8E5R5_9ZZZZ
MKMKSLVVVIVLALTCVFGAAALASSPVKLLVNGQEIVSDVPPQIIEGRTMVPVRWIAEALGAEVQWDEKNKAVNINKPYFVADLPEAKAKLYPFAKQNGMYHGFILEVQGQRQYFEWQNVSNPTFAPRLLFNDINLDGEKELIVILTTGTGTGVHIEDIHVLNPDTFSEMDVERPGDIIKNNVISKIELMGDLAAIHFTIAGEDTSIYKEKDYAAVWFDQVSFSNYYRYDVVDNQLLVSIPAQASPAGFIGEIESRYVFSDGTFKAGTITYAFNSDRDNEEVVSLIEGFGSKLQNVSLLAPEDMVKESLHKNYGDYVAPMLLAEWEKDLRSTPGRVSSSPWPERIEIIKMIKLSDSAYDIQGEIVEMTSVEMVNGGFAAKRPVVIRAEIIGNRWFITAVSIGDYQQNNVIVYKNNKYGFSFSLPDSWQGYSIITDKWEGFVIGSSQEGVATETGPLISIRHPLWTDHNQRQDIPIMIFTLNQWGSLQLEKFHIGAAPMGPKELGRNTEYVFALPARYNYAFPAGFEEVEKILDNDPLH